MKYYSALKRQEVLIHATTLINLENMVSEIRCKRTLYEVPNVVKLIETESRIVVNRGWEEGKVGTDFKFGTVRKFWRWIMGTVAQQCECTKCHYIVHLKMIKMVSFMFILPQF